MINPNIFLIFFKFRLEKIKLARINAEFPDEVDTPMDQPARIRFQK
jgi:hypothetical protein